MQSADSTDLGIIRLAPGLRFLPRDDGGAIVMTGSGRYVRVGNTTLRCIQKLSNEEYGLPVLQASKMFPRADLNSLISRGIFDYQPVFARRPSFRLAGQLWRRNIGWRTKLRARGWDVFQPLISEKSDEVAEVSTCRPAVFDQVEAAARLSLAIPGTSAQCTVVSATIHDCLLAMGFPARVVLLGSADQFMFHARAYVGDHAIDPADALVDLEPFRSLSSCALKSISESLL